MPPTLETGDVEMTDADPPRQHAEFLGLLWFDPLDKKAQEYGESAVKFDFERDIESGTANVVDAGITLASLLPDAPEGEIAEYGNVCKFFLKGTCQKGDNCQYRHVRSREAVLCKHWLNGLCKKGPQCEFLHQLDLAKMPVCQFFSKGQCLRDDCLFRHILPKDTTKECPWYARGFCRHGPRCRNKHVRKFPCERYLAGFCPDGPRCKFGHPKFELPLDADDVNQRVRPPVVCHVCGGTGHRANQCHQADRRAPPDAGGPQNRRPLDQVTCFKCGEKGHYANHCPNKRAPQQGVPGHNNPLTQHKMLFQLQQRANVQGIQSFQS